MIMLSTAKHLAANEILRGAQDDTIRSYYLVLPA